MKQVALEDFLKKSTGAKMELFVVLVGSFHPLTNSTKSLNIGAKGASRIL